MKIFWTILFLSFVLFVNNAKSQVTFGFGFGYPPPPPVYANPHYYYPYSPPPIYGWPYGYYVPRYPTYVYPNYPVYPHYNNYYGNSYRHNHFHHR